MVRNHQENLQLLFEDVKYVDRFLWWDICLARMALQINSKEFSSALSSAPIVVPDTYSQKVIPAPIWMKVQLEGTLPLSTIRGQGKDEASARHCFIHDWILKNHWSEGRSDSQTDYGHIRLEACSGLNIWKHTFSQGKKAFKKNMPSNPTAIIDVSF